MLISAQRHLDLQNPGVCDWRGPARKSYPTVRLGAPAKSKYSHSKTGRRVDLARVRYGTMLSERRRTRHVTYATGIPDFPGFRPEFPG